MKRKFYIISQTKDQFMEYCVENNISREQAIRVLQEHYLRGVELDNIIFLPYWFEGPLANSPYAHYLYNKKTMPMIAAAKLDK
jgi:hypothetical protein